jgi:crotonobetainyl-CoA:carnitine CoA-transferase CaiB-like acyl-CoA transferase
VQDLVWLDGEGSEGARVATSADLAARADEIAGDTAMNPYYRCYSASDGFVAVACLNLAQRTTFLALFGLADSTISAPDVVPADREVLAGKQLLTKEIEQRISGELASVWLERLAVAGVPSSPVLVRESVPGDAQVRAAGLVAEVVQPGLGSVQMLRSLVGEPEPAPAPDLGADTDAVLAELG